jgi:hypothetical protein
MKPGKIQELVWGLGRDSWLSRVRTDVPSARLAALVTVQRLSREGGQISLPDSYDNQIFLDASDPSSLGEVVGGAESPIKHCLCSTEIIVYMGFSGHGATLTAWVQPPRADQRREIVTVSLTQSMFTRKRSARKPLHILQPKRRWLSVQIFHTAFPLPSETQILLSSTWIGPLRSLLACPARVEIRTS